MPFLRNSLIVQVLDLRHPGYNFLCVDCLKAFFFISDKVREEKREEGDGEETNGDQQVKSDDSMEEEGDQTWTMEEKDKLLQFVTKVFLMNFPSYIAYKHVVHSSLEVSLT